MVECSHNGLGVFLSTRAIPSLELAPPVSWFIAAGFIDQHSIFLRDVLFRTPLTYFYRFFVFEIVGC